MFSADYVVPPALSIPLGTSGSSVDVVKEENGTFSINGETITAETRVTAENGNVYRALLSPEGLPIGVDHVAAMQDVMLGSQGGTITLTQSEDKSWKLGDITVTDGYVHTAANGNMYALMMDADGMWSGMYQEVMVTVALGTQGSVTLTRSEDMSWWLGSEAVMNGSMVNSANGNEYMLSMSDDGAWTAMFQPVSMAIEGTGLTAMTREGDDKYDVGDATLAASGTGNVTVDGAMYRVWMMDDGLAGARYDDKFKDGRYNIGNHADGIGNATLSVQDDLGLLKAQGVVAATETTAPATAANELNTHLKVRGEYFSLGSLLETGQASRVGTGRSTMIADALAVIRTARDKAATGVASFSAPGDAALLKSANVAQWKVAQSQVNSIFGSGEVDLGNAENDEDILDDFDEVIDALSSVAAFQAATASGGGGVFEAAKLSADAAEAAFAAEKKEAIATFGAVGNTRFGAFWRKIRPAATKKLDDPAAKDLGAFAYGTTGTLKTLRTRYVRQGTGSAFYAGETRAIDGDGNFFSGDIEIQVRFAAKQVNAVIKNLVGSDGGGWEYLYANTDVSEIILPDTRLGNAASWTGSSTSATASSKGATVTYETRAGVPRPVNVEHSFKGQLLGRDEGDQGNEAVGVWSVGSSGDGTDYLAGGFGAMRGDDLPDLRPPTDSGKGSKTKILPYGDIVKDTADSFSDTDTPDSRGQTIADGMLTVIGRKYDVEGDAIVDVDTTAAVNEAKYRTHKIDLVAALENSAAAWVNGDKHVDIARKDIEKQLNILSSDIGLPKSVKTDAWTSVQDAILKNLFGVKTRAGADVSDPTQITADTDDTDLGTARAALPGQLGLTYVDSRNADYVEAVQEVLDALESNDALKAALSVKGIFYREALADADPDTAGNQKQVILAKANGKGAGDVNLFARVDSRVQYLIGSTDFTRFGAWRRQTSPNAQEGYVSRDVDNNGTPDDTTDDTAGSEDGDGPNSLAYSQLGPTSYTSVNDPRYPADARMTYSGSTIAVLGGVFWQGDVAVDVVWNSTDSTVGATANMSFSNIENVANGARMYIDTDVTNNRAERGLRHDFTGNTPSDSDYIAGQPVHEVSSIAISNIEVNDNLALSLDSTDDSGTTTDRSDLTIAYLTAGNASPVEVTFHEDVNISAGTPETDVKVDGQFVGLGLTGPLAVLGTWEFSNLGSDLANHAIGAKVEKAAYQWTATQGTPDNTDDDVVVKIPAKVSVTGVGLYGLMPTSTPSGGIRNGIEGDTFVAVPLHGGFGAEAP